MNPSVAVVAIAPEVANKDPVKDTPPVDVAPDWRIRVAPVVVEPIVTGFATAPVPMLMVFTPVPPVPMLIVCAPVEPAIVTGAVDEELPIVIVPVCAAAPMVIV